MIDDNFPQCLLRIMTQGNVNTETKYGLKSQKNSHKGCNLPKIKNISLFGLNEKRKNTCLNPGCSFPALKRFIDNLFAVHDIYFANFNNRLLKLLTLCKI